MVPLGPFSTVSPRRRYVFGANLLLIMSSMSQDEPPYLPNGRPRRIHDHNMTFLDHRGNQAIMSWQNQSAEDKGLPPLWCWALYFINPDFNISLEVFDSAQFKRGLFKDAALSDFTGERFEFYYLPGATPEDCVAHYRAELEKRGTIWEDLERLDQALARRGQVQAQEDLHHFKGLPG